MHKRLHDFVMSTANDISCLSNRKVVNLYVNEAQTIEAQTIDRRSAHLIQIFLLFLQQTKVLELYFQLRQTHSFNMISRFIFY
jgi:hypothetical protein